MTIEGYEDSWWCVVYTMRWIASGLHRCRVLKSPPIMTRHSSLETTLYLFRVPFTDNDILLEVRMCSHGLNVPNREANIGLASDHVDGK